MSKHFSFFLDGKGYCAKKFNPKESLNNIRKALKNKIDSSIIFYYKDETPINIDDEQNYSLEEISKDEKVFLKHDSSNFESFQIYLNGNLLTDYEGSKDEKLSNLRKNLSSKIKKTAYFIDQNKSKIDKENEEGEDAFTINDILLDGNIFIQQENAPIKEYRTPSQLDNNKSPAPSLEPNKPIEGSKLIKNIDGLKIYKYPEINFTPEDNLNEITIMVVGQTGSGKTTLLNSFVNFLYGIRYEDDFRYKIIVEENNRDQSKSLTKNVNIYRIAAHGDYPPFLIIDTPGYGDTEGINRDKEITELIKQKFEKEVTTINAICFVAQSSNARLTPNQKYIFNSIIKLFGNNVGENFIIMMTFCDAQEPPLKNALMSSESDLLPILKLSKDKTNLFLKFNNSAIFATNKDIFNEMFWKLGMENFENFIKKLKSLNPKSLTLTNEVLNKRKQLNATVEGLIPQLNLGLSKLESIRQQLEKIEEERIKINGSKNFIIYSDVPKIKKVDLKPGEYVTNCLNCNYTCHYPCYIRDDQKSNCDAMKNGKCTVCPKRCIHSDHKNAKFRIVVELIKEKTSLKDLEQKFFDSKKNLTKYEQIRSGLNEEFKNIKLKCLNIQRDVKKYVDRLKEIGLDSKIYSSTDYIDLLIQNEENNRKAGWQGRRKGLLEMKKIYETIKNSYEADNNNIIPFDEYEEKYIKDLDEKNEKSKKEFEKKGDDDCIIF